MLVTQYFNTLTRFWHQLDLFETYSWKCADDTALYRSIVEKRRTFKFLHGLNKELDAVRSRIMSIKPLPSVKEAFSEVRHEESRKKVMMGASPLPSTQESSALTARGQQKGRPWCDHCRKPGHFRDTCWKLHGKPADWKPKSWKDKESHGNVAATLNTAAVVGNGDTSDSSPFTKAQLEALQKLLSQSHIIAKPDTTPGTGHLAMKGNLSVAFIVNKRTTNPWILDSGASDHMTGDANIFSEFHTSPEHHTVKIADGTLSKVEGLGSVNINQNLTLTSVLYVPKLDCNLLSISKFTRDLNCVTKFYSNLCVFQELDSGKMIGSAKMCSGLYILQDYTPSVRITPKFSLFSLNNQSISNKDSDIMLWHYRLGHPNFLYLSKMFPSLFTNKNLKLFCCEICQFAKHTRSTYSRIPYKSSKPFSLIHSDVWGPSRVNNITGHRWFVSFIDDHTRLTWVFLMKSKSEVSEIFKNFHSMIQTQFLTKIQILKTDNAKDFFNSILDPYLTQQGILHLSSCVDTPPTKWGC